MWKDFLKHNLNMLILWFLISYRQWILKAIEKIVHLNIFKNDY